MALLHCQIDSKILDLEMSVQVILPDDVENSAKKLPTLYLLHGLSGNSKFVDKKNIHRTICIKIPSGGCYAGGTPKFLYGYGDRLSVLDVFVRRIAQDDGILFSIVKKTGGTFCCRIVDGRLWRAEMGVIAS